LGTTWPTAVRDACTTASLAVAERTLLTYLTAANRHLQFNIPRWLDWTLYPPGSPAPATGTRYAVAGYSI